MRAAFIIAAASFAALLTAAGQAQAQANRTFVSGDGSDSNACSRAAPCRTFAAAILQTNAGGEIAVLDTAGYGVVTITKSVSIINEDGVEAGVTATSGDGITVNVNTTDVVNLRGITLTGGGLGNNGINFINLGTLNIQNCVVKGFRDGVSFVPGGTAALNVSDTTLASNSGVGVLVGPSGSGTVTALFNRLQVNGAGLEGIDVAGAGSTGTINVTVANSAVSNNSTGIAAGTTMGAAMTQVTVSNSVVSNNVTGVADDGVNSFIHLAKNTITGNTTAFNVSDNGTLDSFGDNYITGNTDNGGAIPLISSK